MDFDVPVSGTWCFHACVSVTTLHRLTVWFTINGYADMYIADLSVTASSRVLASTEIFSNAYKNCVDWCGYVASTDDVRVFSRNNDGTATYSTTKTFFSGVLVREGATTPFAQGKVAAFSALGSAYVAERDTATLSPTSYDIDSTWFSVDDNQFTAEYSGTYFQVIFGVYGGPTYVTIDSYDDGDLTLGVTESGRTVAYGRTVFVSSHMEAGETTYVGGQISHTITRDGWTITYLGDSSYRFTVKGNGTVEVSADNTYAIAWDAWNPHSSASGFTHTDFDDSRSKWTVPLNGDYTISCSISFTGLSDAAHVHLTANSYAADDYDLAATGDYVRGLGSRTFEWETTEEEEMMHWHGHLRRGEFVYCGIYVEAVPTFIQAVLSVSRMNEEPSKSPTPA